MSRELDAQVAERIMGWTNIHINDRGEMYAVTPDSAPGRTRVTPFTTDLNACAQAEARVIGMGLGARYAAALEAVICELRPLQELMGGTMGTEHIDYEFAALYATASAEARCRAMLQVVGEKE